MNTREGVNYPNRCQKEPIINTLHKVKAGRRKSYYVDGTVNKENLELLFDTGAELDELRKEDLGELGIDLSESALRDIQKRQSENLHLSYADVFSKGKRDIGKYLSGVQHRIPLKAGATPVKQQLRIVLLPIKKESSLI